MTNEITTTLGVSDNQVDPVLLDKWLSTLPSNAVLTFVIQKGYDDRFSYRPDRVTGIKATWKMEI